MSLVNSTHSPLLHCSQILSYASSSGSNHVRLHHLHHYLPALWATKAAHTRQLPRKYKYLRRPEESVSFQRRDREDEGWLGRNGLGGGVHTHRRVSAVPFLSSCLGRSPWPHGWSAALWWPECSIMVHHRSPGGCQGTKPSSQLLGHTQSFCSSLHR